MDGNAVMEVTGLLPGPEVGRVLRELTEKVMERPELNNRDDLKTLIKFIGTSA